MFWTDRWVGNDTLKNRYFRLLLNSVHKEGTLEQYGYGTRINGSSK